jgi:site-specific recombinase XerD
MRPARADWQSSSGCLAGDMRTLRWMNERFRLEAISDLTPQFWYAWLDQRLAHGISPNTLNGELSVMKHFVYFLQDQDRPVCERFLLVDRLEEGINLPKDVPIEQLRLLQKAIHAQTVNGNVGARRLGRMDLAWFLLMLHSGLCTGEVRNLKLADIEWEA